MKVTLVQPQLYWKDPTANRADLEELLWQNDTDSDLIVLPETFNTGFAPEASELAEPYNGSTMQWMKQLAKQFNSSICGTLFIKKEGHTFNTFVYVSSTGEYNTYDKKHLFGHEKESVVNGDSFFEQELNGIQLGAATCYDLRFPAWIRKAAFQKKVLIIPANWPKSRIEHWRTLLTARAIENQCYVIGVNITGGTIGNIEYAGNSMVIAYDGTVLFEADDSICIHSVELDMEGLHEYRKNFPFLNDADNFNMD